MRYPIIKDGLSPEQLHSVLDYDPGTGLFRWREGIDHWRAGLPAGTRSLDYVLIGIKMDGRKRLYRAHRLAWLYVHGEWPDGQVDHINGVKHDNRIANLRVATNQQNAINRAVRMDNTSGYKGVSWNKRSGRWLAHISYGGKIRHLGLFDDIEDAITAYSLAAQRYHGEFARAP